VRGCLTGRCGEAVDVAAPRAILFDLDDTLYPRRRFVLSGFRAVAAHLARTESLDAELVFGILARRSRGSIRGLPVQACLTRFGLSHALVPALIDIVRTHQPDIRLPRESRRALEILRHDWRLGIVTNGLPAVQARKVEALGLRPLVDTVVFAGQHGTGKGKPDPIAFVTALRRLDVPPSRALFVGDDDYCDLSGAARVGLRTVFCDRYLRGAFAPPRHADATVGSLARVSQVAARLLPEEGRRHVA
jgi:putative hydrolase of the HAD superfamily